MTPLSEDLLVLLDAERDIDPPSPAEHRRLLERLEPALLVPVAVAAAAIAKDASTASAVNTLGTALKAKLAIAIASATLVGGAIGAGGHAYLAPAPMPAQVKQAKPEQPRVTLPSADSAAPIAEPAPSASTASPAVSTPRERPAPKSSLRAERLLIETATAALLRSDRPAAIAALRRHAAQFPHGDLAQEREVLLQKALRAQ